MSKDRLFGGEEEDFIPDDIDVKFDKLDKFEIMDQKRLIGDNYVPPSQLKIPPEVKERFKSVGYYLKWVRFRSGNTLDTKSIRKRMSPQEGYSFVSPDEFLPGEALLLGENEVYQGSSIITNGELVLMKVRIERAEARRKYYQGMTSDKTEAINRQLQENKIDTKGSRSVVRTGKNAHFSS